LLDARYKEVIRQFKVADPTVDVSRIKKQTVDHTNFDFKVSATKTK
jgi:hypothetical protein